MKKEIKNIVFCAMYIALGVAVANILHWAATGIGRVLSPMHFTVIIAGLMLGWKYGLVAGILTPLISAIFGMPPFFPTGVCMALECGVYGLVAGLLSAKLVIMKDETQKNIYRLKIYKELKNLLMEGKYYEEGHTFKN